MTPPLPSNGSEPDVAIDVPAPIDLPVANGPHSDHAAAVVVEVEHQHQLVQDTASRAGARLETSVERRRAELAATFAAQRQQANVGLASFSATTAQQTAAGAAKVTGVAATSRSGIDAQAVATRQGIDERIGGMAEQVSVAGDEQGNRAISGANEGAASARPSTASSDPDLAEGQEHIADAIDGKARTELSAAGTHTAQQVRSGVDQLTSGLYRPAQQHASQQADTVVQDAGQALARGETSAGTALAQTSAAAQHAAVLAHRSVDSALRTGQRTAEADLRAWATAAAARIHAAAQQIGTSLVEQGRSFAALVDARHGRRTQRSGFAERASSAVREAGEQAVLGLDEATTQLDDGGTQLADAHSQAVSGIGDSAAEALGKAGQGASTALNRITGKFGEHAEAGQAEVVADLQQGPAQAAAALDAEHQRGLTGLAATVDRAATVEASWVDNAHRTGHVGNQRFIGEAERLAGQARQPVQRLFGELIGSMRSWLRENLGDVWGGIVSGIILSLPAIAIAVGLLLSGPVGWGILAALFVVGAGLGIYARFSEYAADHGGQGPSIGEGFALVALGILDITGVPYIIEALAGQRAFAPHPMGRFEKYERGTQGVINLALLVVGGAKKLFGRTAGEVKPVAKPAEPVPIEPKPAEGPRPAERVEPTPLPTNDPATVPITGDANNTRFESARGWITKASPGERVRWTQVLFRRLRETSGDTWQYNEHVSADGGTHWTGEGAPFLFAIDPQGNVFQGRVGPETLVLEGQPLKGQPVYSKLRPLTGPPAPPPPPTPVPAPPQTPPPTPVPSNAPPIPPIPPHLPPPPHDDREPATVP
ncbi:MAG: hypothetical protein ACR2GH_13790 [Pseudonocardia sp.]